MVFVRIQQSSGEVVFTVDTLTQVRVVLADIYNLQTPANVLSLAPGNRFVIEGEYLQNILSDSGKYVYEGRKVQILNLG